MSKPIYVFSLDDDGGEGSEGGEGAEDKMPSCGDYVLHFLTLFWKILFAFVPPTGNKPPQSAPLCCSCAPFNEICLMIFGHLARSLSRTRLRAAH